ncbi:MAG TPA: cytochrome c [Kofleriaceae bacterium]|nr:cytochrome c [Kofleriaceae bacterium]
MRQMLALLALAAIGLLGCDLDLERMIDQPRRSTYEACDVCPGGTVMMTPPEGTVPRQPSSGPGVPGTTGAARGPDGAYVQTIPIRVDRAVMARGRSRFDIFCAACHGRLGDGQSQVAENMTLRRPPSLVEPPYADYPPGRIHAAITDGFGLMRSYAAELSASDRWAVVAYVEALRLARRAPLVGLPARVREEAAPWLR